MYLLVGSRSQCPSSFSVRYVLPDVVYAKDRQASQSADAIVVIVQAHHRDSDGDLVYSTSLE